MLLPVERDFIDFIAHKRNLRKWVVKKKYLDLRSKFDFASPEFRELMFKNYQLAGLLYDDSTEIDAITAFSHHGLLNIYRFMSYFRGKAHIRDLAETILSNLPDKKEIVLVDYGCGLSQYAFEINCMKPGINTYLVDIDSLTLEFAHYRYQKNMFKVKKIVVDEKNIYPELPIHDVCIANEVFEHVCNPELLFKNIDSSLKKNGLLYACLEDHHKEMFHVSPNLSAVRTMISDYEEISKNLYKK